MRRNEHYVVTPNTPDNDWPYEYSTPSDRDTSCNCGENNERVSVLIGNLQTAVA
jgi:hypothetical protein